MAVSTKVFVGDLPEGFDEAGIASLFGPYGEVKWCKVLPGKDGKGAAMIEFGSADEAQWFVDNLNGNIPEGLTTPIEARFATAKGAGKDAKGVGKVGFYSAFAKGGKDVGKGCYGKAAPALPGKSFAPYGKGGKDGKNGKGDGKSMKGILIAANQGGRIPQSEQKPDENCLYITGLPGDCTDRDLYELCCTFGAIASKGVRAMQKDGICTGVGFVDYVEESSAQWAIESLNEHEGLSVVTKNSTKGKGKGDGIA
jgi:RNA recognition motif-containing protein